MRVDAPTTVITVPQGAVQFASNDSQNYYPLVFIAVMMPVMTLDMNSQNHLDKTSSEGDNITILSDDVTGEGVEGFFTSLCPCHYLREHRTDTTMQGWW